MIWRGMYNYNQNSKLISRHVNKRYIIVVKNLFVYHSSYSASTSCQSIISN